MEEKGKDTLDSNKIKEENKDVQEKHVIGKSLDKEEKEIREKEIKSKERTSTFNAENANLEGNNILNGDGTINVENHNHYNNEEVLGLPTSLELIDPNDIKFNVDSCSCQYIPLLLEEYFIILNCAHDGIANSLKQAVAQDKKFESFLKYEVSFDDYSQSNISYLIEHCQTRIIKNEQKLLLFIYDSYSTETPKLLRSITKINNLGRTKILNLLRNNIYIIYLSYHDNQNYLNTSCFNFYYIDAFNIYAKNRSFSRERILLIKKQQTKGLWGNDRELLADLDKYESEVEVESIILNKEKEERVDFKSIIKNKKQPIARYVLFVATFLPKITPDVFREYINTLLSDKTIPVKKKRLYLSEIWNDEADDILDDCQLISYNNNNQRIIGFTSTADALLCEQQLFKSINFVDQQARILIESQQLFTENTSKREYERIYLIITKLSSSFRAFYGDELLRKWLIVIENQRKKSEDLQLESNIIRLYRKQIKDKIRELENLQYKEDKLAAFKSIAPINLKYKYDALINELKITKFLFYKEESYPKDLETSAITEELKVLRDDLLEKLQKIEKEKNKISNKVNKNVEFFANLLSTIYNKDSSRDIVFDFFTRAFATIYRNYIVVDVLNKFQVQHVDFNGFEYYKQTLENNNKKTNKYAFQAFISLFLSQPEHFYLFVERIKQWFPKQETPYKSYTKLEKYTLAILYVYLSTQMNSDKSNNRLINGNTQRSLFAIENGFSKYIHFIIYNIYNLHLVDILDELFFNGFEDKRIQEDKIKLKCAEIIEYWYQLLKGLIINQENNKSMLIYIDSIHEQLDKSQKRTLITQLGEIRKLYNERISNTNNSIDVLISKSTDHKEEKERIKTKRNNVAEFINLVKK